MQTDFPSCEFNMLPAIQLTTRCLFVFSFIQVIYITFLDSYLQLTVQES